MTNTRCVTEDWVVVGGEADDRETTGWLAACPADRPEQFGWVLVCSTANPFRQVHLKGTHVTGETGDGSTWSVPILSPQMVWVQYPGAARA